LTYKSGVLSGEPDILHRSSKGTDMLRISPDHIAAVAKATNAEALYTPLQNAVELEHSTIPLYFTAYISIKPSATDAMAFIRSTIQSVFLEEMLHMAIACNVLNAIGGQPRINNPDFIPQYPGHLPMVGEFEVHLGPLSGPQLQLFLKIEEPENGPLHFPVAAGVAASTPTFATIGQFYHAIMAKITELGDGIFIGNSLRQVTGAQIPFFAGKLSPVTNAAEAIAALQLIVDQGEGTSQSPLDDAGAVLAHYYRFNQIAEGHKLIPDPRVAEGYSYTGDRIEIKPECIEDMISDPKLAQLKLGTPARQAVAEFNAGYCQILDQLQQVFDGSPGQFSPASMFALSVLGRKVVSTVDAETGKKASPSFEYSEATTS
jgi:ferritin-like protein